MERWGPHTVVESEAGQLSRVQIVDKRHIGRRDDTLVENTFGRGRGGLVELCAVNIRGIGDVY